MSKERKPVKHVVYDRDHEGKRDASAKGRWKKSGLPLSLKQFARAEASRLTAKTPEFDHPKDPEGAQACADWLHNKTCNATKLSLGLGSTRKKNKKNKVIRPL
jgi:hypothetical protein